jgi:integral membrane protein (TIGR01906 family)
MTPTLYQILKIFARLSVEFYRKSSKMIERLCLEGGNMNLVKRLLVFLCVIASLFALLLTSVQIAVYSDMNFFEKEYTKYNVLEAVHMQMDDLMKVTDHLLGYMMGQEDDLVVETTIAGQTREFFNEREKTHMVDVRNLFLLGFKIRNLCVILVILLILAMKFFLREKLIPLLSKGFLTITVVISILFAGLGLLIARNFTKAFTIFHKILFPQNDFWILDPSTDLLINIVPEGFFVDMAVRIGMFFAGAIIILIIASILGILYSKKKVYI